MCWPARSSMGRRGSSLGVVTRPVEVGLVGDDGVELYGGRRSASSAPTGIARLRRSCSERSTGSITSPTTAGPGRSSSRARRSGSSCPGRRSCRGSRAAHDRLAPSLERPPVVLRQGSAEYRTVDASHTFRSTAFAYSESYDPLMRRMFAVGFSIQACLAVWLVAPRAGAQTTTTVTTEPPPSSSSSSPSTAPATTAPPAIASTTAQKVSYCHRSSSVLDPYDLQATAVDSIVAQGHGGHTGPVFPQVGPDAGATSSLRSTTPSGKFPGLNWPAGSDVLEAGCAVYETIKPPEETTTTTAATTTTTAATTTTTAASTTTSSSSSTSSPPAGTTTTTPTTAASTTTTTATTTPGQTTTTDLTQGNATTTTVGGVTTTPGQTTTTAPGQTTTRH